MQQATTTIYEASTGKFAVPFVDETGAAVTPNSAAWTLTDTEGTIVNSRNAVNIASLSTSVNIVLSEDDLAVSDSYLGLQRLLTVRYVYDSDAGDGLIGVGVVLFALEDTVIA